MNVFVARSSEAQPETRIQDGCTIEELLGVFASREGAQRAYDEHLARRIAETVDDEYDDGVPSQERANNAMEYLNEMEHCVLITECEVKP